MSQRRRRPNGIPTRTIHNTFGTVVAPLLCRWLGGGRVFQVEREKPKDKTPCRCGLPEHHAAVEACRLLDAAGKIDYFHQAADGKLRGIGARIQPFESQSPERQREWLEHGPYNTFTIRARDRGVKVESDFYREALAADPRERIIMPTFMMHAYTKGDELISCGMAYAYDVFALVDGGRFDYRPPRPIQVYDGNMMLVVPWRDLTEHGVTMWQYHAAAGPRLQRVAPTVPTEVEEVTLL